MNKNTHWGISPIVWAKLDRNLQREISRHHGDPSIEFPIIILVKITNDTTDSFEDLTNSLTRKNLSQKKQAFFKQKTKDLVQNLKQLGVIDIKMLWINNSLSARVKIPALNKIGIREDIKEIILSVRHKVIVTKKSNKGV